MLGLFGSLDLGARSLQTQQQGVEIAGQNLANVNNPAYSRQRLAVAASTPVDTAVGQQGTGVGTVAIERLRSAILDSQIQSETSVRGSLAAQQTALQYAEANLGQTIDGSTAAQGISALAGGQSGLAANLSALFNRFQSLSTAPSSPTERRSVLSQATQLATQFNQIDQRLGGLNGQLNESVKGDISSANELLSQIADLNSQIAKSEQKTGGESNDLRDLREQKLEALSGLVKVDAAVGERGAVNISIAGTSFVEGGQALDSLETFAGPDGGLLVRSKGGGTPLDITGGSVHGTIEARDGTVAGLRSSLNALASQLIQEVNAIHREGFGLTGTTGADFFNGTGAGDIKVNPDLVGNPSLLQAARSAGAVGDRRTAVALAQLADKRVGSLADSTFSQSYAQTVAGFGQAISSVDRQLSDQNAVSGMLEKQRASVSGVSVDEEMTNLMKYQKAYAASAKLITTIDDMLNDVINLKR